MLLLLLSTNINSAFAEGNIGCVFAPNLCEEPLEWCFDDNAFGQCLPIDEENSLASAERLSFSVEQVQVLKNVLEELNGAGLDWNHPFTQCRVQKTILAMKNVINIEDADCSDFAPLPEMPDDEADIVEPEFPRGYIHFVEPEYIQKKSFNDFPLNPSIVERLHEQKPSDDYDNMVREIKNRIELRRMMAERQHQEKDEDTNTEYLNDREDEIPRQPGIFTEGGVMYTRHERLDVKKPGPHPAIPDIRQDKTKSNEDIFSEQKSKDLKVKKIVHDVNDDHANYSVDSEFAHVILKNNLDSWAEGERIVQALGEMLNLQNYLTHTRVDRQEVSFKVEPNPEKKTAYDVAKSINDLRFKNNLSRRMGVLVLRAGVGDKVKDYDTVWKNTRIEAIESMNMKTIMIIMIITSTVLAIAICILVLICYKRVMKKREKLNNLQSNLTKNVSESTNKDYQELCRARMATKNEISSTKVASLSKENDKPPSSRSSTSSWSEDNAFNMDISTGHIVLSYMEDHLKNKGRLQREWEALCRYEAEPNSREAALHEDTIALNRSEIAVPYDHSRVVLNHLVNSDGLDYINASTITDVDPRAPAYIIAQSPLETTATKKGTENHFWQMVWEQGCVIIVTLCRLQENGENACARYWPEEGSQTYHIYEVHLVSEHIWTDDYLVRSFYLKNIKTGETRTVTQFHFMSWGPAAIPVSAKVLLEFRRKVNKSYRGRSCPVIVHSSLGVGRAGAYVLLDLVLGRMNKGAREIDIAATLEHLRDQRASLVETKQQFEFVLTAVAEEVHSILKALPSAQSGEKRDSESKESSSAAKSKGQQSQEKNDDEKQANEK